MTAKDYLRTYQKAMYFFDEISQIINELYEMRHEKEKIQIYFERILQQDIRFYKYEDEYKEWTNLGQKHGWAGLIEPEYKPNEGEIDKDSVSHIREGLLEVIREDISFGHLFNLLSKDKGNFITQQEIETAIRKEDEEEKIEEIKLKPFSAYLVNTNEEAKKTIIEELKEILRGKKGKNVAKVLCGMKEAGIIAYSDREKKSLYASMKVIFGNIGCDESINKPLRVDWKTNEKHKKGLNRSDIEPYFNLFKKYAVT